MVDPETKASGLELGNREAQIKTRAAALGNWKPRDLVGHARSHRRRARHHAPPPPPPTPASFLNLKPAWVGQLTYSCIFWDLFLLRLGVHHVMGDEELL